MSGYAVLATIVMLVHFSYVSFVVVGLVAIAYGLARGREWARNFWFRIAHLAAIGIVVAQAWLGIVCPLTRLEWALRRWAGQEPSQIGFIDYWVRRVMFHRLPPWVFVAAYSLFGLAVLATFLLGPPRRPGAKSRRAEAAVDPRSIG